MAEHTYTSSLNFCVEFSHTKERTSDLCKSFIKKILIDNDAAPYTHLNAIQYNK
jgi:hypothetical protein